MGVEAVGTGIKTNLSNITDLRIYAPNELPDSINEFPTALIQHIGTIYDQSMGGLQIHTYKIKIALTRQDLPSALNAILDYLENTGAKSIRAKIDADPTLNGSAQTASVISNSGQGAFMWGGILYLGTEFEIEVHE